MYPWTLPQLPESVRLALSVWLILMSLAVVVLSMRDVARAKGVKEAHRVLIARAAFFAFFAFVGAAALAGISRPFRDVNLIGLTVGITAYVVHSVRAGRKARALKSEIDGLFDEFKDGRK